MANLFAELKRRHIYRVAAAYAVVAWMLLQLFNNLEPILKLPDSAGTLVLVLLLGGFPVALIFAWVLELKAPAADGTVKAGTTRTDFVMAGALAVVIALILYQQLAPARTVQQASITSASAPGIVSIAVLPFANLSGDTAQEFFSDGMTEEITSALAKVPTLRMVGRTSAFQFKGQNKDLRAIGQSLGAAYLIEGSVRKAGERVRVTVQLVKAGDGIGLWTDNYDREIKDIFATQEDIAQAIAGALRVPLGLKRGDTLVRNRAKDVESYDQYLRAKALVHARGLQPLTEAAALLEQVVARDPNYAPGWALLAYAYYLTPTYTPERDSGSVDDFHRIADASLPKAESAARRAIQLDAALADGYSALGSVQSARGKVLVAADLFKKALALDSNNPDALYQYSQTLARAGRAKEALAMKQRLQGLEPFVPVFKANLAVVLWVNGQNEAAIAMLKDEPPEYRSNIAQIYAAMGRYNEAANAVLEISAGRSRSEAQKQMVEEAARLLRTAPAKATSPQTLPRLGTLGWVYFYVGASGRALEFHEGSVEAGHNVGLAPTTLWHPSYAPIRKMERFKAYVRKAGYVEYWRARGWPDLCRPVGADDFVCD